MSICTPLRLAAVLAATAASAAFAQSGAMWQDDVGRTTTLEFAGGTSPAPLAKDRSVGEMVDLFKRACLPASGPQSAALQRLAGEGTLEARPFTIPATKKAAAIPLDVYQGDGVVIARTDGFFVAPQAQCNAVFYVDTLPDTAALNAAMQAALGTPTNAAEAVDKKGKPRKSYSPEWSAQVDGKPAIVVARIMGQSTYMRGNRVHLAVRVKS